MDTIVLRALFRTEPSAEVQMIIERKLKNIAKLLAPEVEPELSKGHGSFWISVSVVAVPVLGWLAIQTAGWAWKKIVLERHVGPMLEGKRTCEESPEGTSAHGDEQVLGESLQRIPFKPELVDSATHANLQQAFSDLIESLDPYESVQVRLAKLGSDPESVTGIKGIVCILGREEGRKTVDLIEVDSREDFYSLLL